MRITSWNFLHGQGLEPGGASSADEALTLCLNVIASDVIALQEVDCNQERSGGANQIEEIARELGAQWWRFAPTLSGTPGVAWGKYNGGEECSYGIGIISTIPVVDWLQLDLRRSLIGMPLAVGSESGKMRLMYIKDEPRIALAAVMENGWTVINTHLSFVPLVNIYQFLKLSRWAKKIESEYSTRVLLVGDFNLPWGIPSKITRWKRATQALSYPSWNPKISFDYIFARQENLSHLREVEIPALNISDHRPVSVEVN